TAPWGSRTARRTRRCRRTAGRSRPSREAGRARRGPGVRAARSHPRRWLVLLRSGSGFARLAEHTALPLRVGAEELPDDRGGAEVAAHPPDECFRQILAAAGPGVAAAIEPHEHHLAAV